MKLWKYSGTFLSVTGVIHIIYAMIQNWSTYEDLFSEGLINSIGDNAQRALSFWFFLIGVLLIMFGQSLQHHIKKQKKPAPLSLGYALLFFSAFGCFIIPLSGFWLFIPQALIIILAKREHNESNTIRQNIE